MLSCGARLQSQPQPIDESQELGFRVLKYEETEEWWWAEFMFMLHLGFISIAP
jgi:hypothetical protein